MRPWRTALVIACFLPAAQCFARGDVTPVRVVVEDPAEGATVRGRFDMVRVAGLAEAGERQAVFDVVLVVDVSGSTAYPSGIDVDRDGVFGATKESLIPGLADTPSTDPDDSILAAEVMAAERLLDSLESDRVRVGVISFSGFLDPSTGQVRPDEPSAQVEHPLSSDFESVRRALQAVKLRGSMGGTDMQAGIKLAVSELAGLPGTVSEARPTARRVILLLTDGLPSLPFGQVNVQDPEDVEATWAAAELAARAGILINVFGMGPAAGGNSPPPAVTRIASMTRGSYVGVRRPGDVVTLLSGVSFASVEDVVAVNLTIGQESGKRDIVLMPDGSFRGFVPVAPGVNRIRVSALASDGTRGSTEFEITYRLQDLSDSELQAELERVRERNRDIEVLTERRRQDAFRKAERERALTLEVEETPEGEGANEGEKSEPPAPKQDPAPKAEPRP